MFCVGGLHHQGAYRSRFRPTLARYLSANMQHARLGLMMPRVSVPPRQSWMGPCYCKDEAP
eukprot:312323-Prymnesium_polylepis.1